MKKFWIVLASLALVAAFAMPAAAVDVKFSGEFYVAGDYYNRTTPNKINTGGFSYDFGGASTAFFHQRLRVQTEFAVSPGLSLITRFDALEKMWGDTAWNGTRGDTFGRPAGSSRYYGNADYLESKAQENIEFEYAYIQYASPAGIFFVGYIPWDVWGTSFGDSKRASGGIMWVKPLGNWTIGALYVKNWEGSTTYKQPWLNRNDNDDNAYVGIVSYANDKVDTGMKVAYRRIANNKGIYPVDSNYDWNLPPAEVNGFLLTPYFKGQFGPVKVQGELEYFDGRVEYNFDQRHTDIRALSAYADAQVAIGPAYVGGLFAYASGVDAAKADKKLTGTNALASEMCWGGRDFKPTLILWNEDVVDWAGNITFQGPGMKNAKLFQIYAGAAVKDFDFKVSLSHARAVETNTIQWYYYTSSIIKQPLPRVAKGSSYGWELDGTVTYKITNNLSYMVGAGYLWTGKYFERKDYDFFEAKNIYMFTNKLTLTF